MLLSSADFFQNHFSFFQKSFRNTIIQSNSLDPDPEICEYGYPRFNVLLQSRLKLERCKQQKAARHPTICEIINDVKYRRIYCRKFLTLSNQMSRYNSKCIRIAYEIFDV